ncbi:hypothetical protein GCM10023329_25730 [Streptomyces sanyensis]|uniref:Uncharacterized protein n=1 Tax=Streptomyces sanyensis TaxID=568869 RepID=A0ABP9A7N4_9ACTN
MRRPGARWQAPGDGEAVAGGEFEGLREQPGPARTGRPLHHDDPAAEGVRHTAEVRADLCQVLLPAAQRC